tara:strand:+ start:1070 stop:1486 length:417 start_codon:yes stop_codon:yes gene_type:complete
MTTYNYKPGLGNAASFQVSGTPFVTGNLQTNAAAVKVSFPSVTGWVAVSNHDVNNDVRIGFSENGVNGTNFIRLHRDAGGGPPASLTLEVKVSEVWLFGADGVDVCAGLTSVDVNAINNPTLSPSGTNWSGSLAALVG